MENNNNDAITNAGGIVSMDNLNQVANWFGATVISAFFSSLERFSCVNVATEDDEYEDEGSDRPLALSTNPYHGGDESDLPV
ncbi:uncharacterized protein [Euphorbia lathyris]|uniref:uncharacterized protein n=1 Tax=Euphorbia lathyris TaxID=212925 RepID=UPI003313E6A8